METDRRGVLAVDSRSVSKLTAGAVLDAKADQVGLLEEDDEAPLKSTHRHHNNITETEPSATRRHHRASRSSAFVWSLFPLLFLAVLFFVISPE